MPPLSKSAMERNPILATYIHSAARHMCIITHQSGTNLSHKLTKEFLLDTPTLKKPIRYMYLPGKRRVVNTIHIKFNTSTMMGGQFWAEGEEQFHYSSLKSTFEPTKIKSKSVLNILAPKTPEIILDEPTPPTRPPTPQTPHPLPSMPKQPLSANTPNSPLTPLPPTLSPIINIPRSRSASRVLNAGGVSTPSPPARTSNHLAGNNLQYSGIGNTDSWIPFPTSQTSAETGGDSNKSEDKPGTDVAYLMPGEEPYSHNQAMSCPDASFWEDAEAHELSQITKLGTYKLVPLPPGHSARGSKWVYKVK